jgi:hypothetical protein
MTETTSHTNKTWNEYMDDELKLRIPTSVHPVKKCGDWWDIDLSHHNWWTYSDGNTYCKHCEISSISVHSLRPCPGLNVDRCYEREYNKEDD